MTATRDWIPTDDRVPDDGEVVLTMDGGGHVQPLKRRGRLWYLADGSMYVYFTPAFWQPVT